MADFAPIPWFPRDTFGGVLGAIKHATPAGTARQMRSVALPHLHVLSSAAFHLPIWVDDAPAVDTRLIRRKQ